MRAERLAEIKDGIENLDTGKYYGADMLSEALLEKNSEARELLEELERIREKNPFLVGDHVKLDARKGEPVSGVVISARSNGVLVRPDEGQPWNDTKTGLWYSHSEVERIED